ncbi:MAG: TfoX/Sxy family protein [Prevotellaceae bacterium]|nr:TfoX/Sxy family protein [Prevotellaceae bacterium]
MASCNEYIDFICSQISSVGVVRSRKMFGDYVVYVNEKAVILVCDNIPYVKIHPAIAHLMTNAEKGFPYKGAKEHYILDVEHCDSALQVVRILEEVLPFPKTKNRKKKQKA